MNADAMVFAMANPNPEVDPEEAAPYVRIMATGRSDYPNQINNVLCFPGIFRGALDVRARAITEEMKMAAARAIAAIVTRRSCARTTSSPRSSTATSPPPSPRRSPTRRARAAPRSAGQEVGFAQGETRPAARHASDSPHAAERPLGPTAQGRSRCGSAVTGRQRG